MQLGSLKQELMESFTLPTIYKTSVACVKVNEDYTAWFPTPPGVRQGDSLSPTLFAIFLNDLVKEIKELGVWIACEQVKLSTLLYADGKK